MFMPYRSVNRFFEWTSSGLRNNKSINDENSPQHGNSDIYHTALYQQELTPATQANTSSLTETNESKPNHKGLRWGKQA